MRRSITPYLLRKPGRRSARVNREPFDWMPRLVGPRRFGGHSEFGKTIIALQDNRGRRIVHLRLASWVEGDDDITVHSAYLFTDKHHDEVPLATIRQNWTDALGLWELADPAPYFSADLPIRKWNDMIAVHCRGRSPALVYAEVKKAGLTAGEVLIRQHYDLLGINVAWSPERLDRLAALWQISLPELAALLNVQTRDLMTWREGRKPEGSAALRLFELEKWALSAFLGEPPVNIFPVDHLRV